MTASIYNGTLPALMTPCTSDRKPDFDALVRKAQQLMDHGMTAMIYAGSMGDWPLLTDAERMEGVERLVDAGIPVIAGTGAVNTRSAVALAAHAQKAGAKGLMVIPRVLSRGAVLSAQKAHFSAILSAAPELEAVIYNSPYYGFATRADLFFALREQHPNLVGFKEFGGLEDLSYAAEHIASAGDVKLTVGVDTSVFHGYVNCGACGAITGIGNVLPREVLHLTNLCKAAARGEAEARQRALELEQAMSVLAQFDVGPDLVLYFKHLLVLRGETEYTLHFNETDELTPSQKGFAERQLALFDAWYADWSQLPGAVQTYTP
jgi:dihydrodipicolinate synthase/N-acetylneuraminate lyase